MTPPCLLFIKFFDTRNFLKHKGFDYEVNRFCGKTNFRRKNVILPCPLHIFFRCQNFLKHRRVPLRNFSVLWVNIFRQKIVAIPLLSHKLYGIWSFVSETDILGRKSCYPPSFSKKFSKPENLWNKEVFPYEIFRYRETKQFRRKIVIPPPLPLLSIQLYDTGSFLKHKKSSRTMFVGTVRKQFFDGKSWYSTSIHIIFRNHNFC